MTKIPLSKLNVISVNPTSSISKENPCYPCSLCCRHIALEIDAPEDARDFSELFWFLYHQGIKVYIDDEGDWMLEVTTRCNNLTDKNECGIHEHAPRTCKEYDISECERTIQEPYWEEMFASPKDLVNYLQKHHKKILQELIKNKEIPPFLLE
ncbi:hypothetical protein D6774_00170 [Candidatus Woesearchaeota archaeon]|jgi:Fe-S-cluster containining protein|nr:MAG: hypothetical protein D6774_00170 [Candidatus Woesearchaeota archaeon]